MKSRNILIAALLMAVVTTVLFFQYLKGLDKKYKSNQNKVSIVVSKQDIPKNTKVTSDMLQMKDVSGDSVLPEAIKKISDLEGQYTVTDIKAGEELFAKRFTKQTDESEQITRKVKKDYRAVTIEVNAVESVANMIQPEDYVDVIGSVKPEGAPLYGTKTVLENVRVLAVGQRLTEKKPAAAPNSTSGATTTSSTSGTSAQNPSQPEYTSVTLELNPDDVEKIVNYDENGKIKLVLRSSVKN